MLTKLRGRLRRDDGMVTAEYTMGILTAVAMAEVLREIITSGPIGDALIAVINRALGTG